MLINKTGLQSANSHIVEVGLSLLAHASRPLKYWDEAFLAATYLINRIPAKILQYSTPLEVLYQEKPGYAMLQIFSCACWPNLQPYNTRKLAFHSKRCAFLGYSNVHKGFKCLDIYIGRIYISRDVVFDEQVFPFSKLHTNAGGHLRSEIELLPLLLLIYPLLGVLQFMNRLWLMIHLILHLMLIKIWKQIQFWSQYSMLFHRGEQARHPRLIRLHLRPVQHRSRTHQTRVLQSAHMCQLQPTALALPQSRRASPRTPRGHLRHAATCHDSVRAPCAGARPRSHALASYGPERTC
jgi:hypothetical protein